MIVGYERPALRQTREQENALLRETLLELRASLPKCHCGRVQTFDTPDGGHCDEHVNTCGYSSHDHRYFEYAGRVVCWERPWAAVARRLGW